MPEGVPLGDADDKRRNVDILYLADSPEIIPVLADWIYGEWAFLYPAMTIGDVATFLHTRMNREHLPLTLVAFEAGQPVGTVSLKMYDMETRKDLPYWLTSLYVAGPWRRRRIGSTLLKRAEQKAAELGIERLFLFTLDEALPGLFYAKAGWRVKEKTIYHSHHITIMEKLVICCAQVNR
jgi:N-acetylglutamate synthase-like GNAT family acetyltransferase